MSNWGTVRMKVAFAEGFERHGETWEDRLKEAHELRELFHEVFGPRAPHEADEAEYDHDQRAPEEIEIEGVRTCVFWAAVESYRTPDETLIELFRCLKKVPDAPLSVIADWKEYLWNKEFCRQRRCWLDLTWSSESSLDLLSRRVFGPDGAVLFDGMQNWIDPNDLTKGADNPNLVSDPPFEKVIGERLSEYALKWAVKGEQERKILMSFKTFKAKVRLAWRAWKDREDPERPHSNVVRQNTHKGSLDAFQRIRAIQTCQDQAFGRTL